MYELVLLFSSVAAGFLGSLLGLGGGIIIVPTLTLLFHVDIRYAIAASLISVVATSSGAAASFLRDRLTNLRLAVFLEVGTVAGAMVGFLVSKSIEPSYLFLLFGAFLLFSALMMLRKKDDSHSLNDHPWSVKMKLAGDYPIGDKVVSYKIEKASWGLFLMTLAGMLSAILGIGSGIFKVLAMDNVMRVPLKISSATSNFMIGVTASASAGAFLIRGDVRPEIVSPVAVGIIIGSWFGAKVMIRMPAATIRKIFVVVLVIVSTQMVMKGLA